MYKGLIDHLAFVYGYICKGRGKLNEKELRSVADGTHTIVRTAPAVIGMEDLQADDKMDLQLALKMDRQIEEAAVFIQSLENF